MNGVHAALIGRCGQDAEVRFTQSGTMLPSVSVAVTDTKAGEATPTEWVKVTRFAADNEDLEALARRLPKGAECYCEGRLRLQEWQGKDGELRHGLSLTAWVLQPLGQLGRRAPRRDPAPAAQRWGCPRAEWGTENG